MTFEEARTINSVDTETLRNALAILQDRFDNLQSLLARWKEFGKVVNDPNSPSILNECIQELENELC